MLKVLRKKGVMKRILWTVAVVIIISFGFLGQAYLLNDRSAGPSYAGKIFGRKVSWDDFQKHFIMANIQAALQYGDNFIKMRPYLNLESETWDRMILLHEADKRRIRISDTEISEAIQRSALFQVQGKFDNLIYEDILRNYFNIRPRAFEEGFRDTLKIVKLFQQETDDVQMTDEEILKAYQWQNEKVQVSYVLFPVEQFTAQIPVDESRLEEYYLAHKFEFLQPPMVNVEYITVAFPEELKKAVEAQGPEENNEQLTAQKKPLEDQAYELVTEIHQSNDFAGVAAQHNLPVGESGYFSSEQPNLSLGWSFPLIQQIFQLDTGEISAPVETPQGYQVLRIKDKKNAYIPEFAEAHDKVKEAWLKSQGKEISKQKAEESLDKLKQEFAQYKLPDFAQIAKQFGLDIYQTPVFNRGQYLPAIGIAKDFQEAAFSLSPENRLSGIVETDKGYAIIHLDTVIPVDQEQFNKEKPMLAQMLLMEKKNETFTDFLSQLRLKADLQENVSKASTSENAVQ